MAKRANGDGTRRPPGGLRVLAGLLALYLVAPFAAGLSQVGGADWAGADRVGLLGAVAVSTASATIATGLVTVGGVPLGYLLARSRRPSVALLGFLVQLPLALPPLASGVLLLFLLGYASPVGRLTGGRLTDSFAGIVLAEVFVAAPFLIVAARSAFAQIDPSLEDVASTLGHRPGAVFRRVSLALVWRPVLAGMLLAWLRAFGEFGATVMVAYHPYSLPVFTYVAFGSEGLPAMVPVLAPTLLVAVAVMGFSAAVLASVRRRAVPVAADPLPAREAAVRPAAAGPALAVTARHRLDGFSLDFDWRSDARRLAILGASGSGKSMTLRLIAGLEVAVEGRVMLGGRDLGALAPHARGLAYVPQTYGLLPHLAVADQILFSVDVDPEAARRWTARLGLTGLEHRRPAELSLGQQQRVALARALSRRSASLVLLDAPFSALDTPLRARLRDELLVLQGEIDAATILVTHDPAEAMLLADDVLLLDRGRALQADPIEEVFARPAGEAAARLLGATLIGGGRALPDGRIDIGGGVLLRTGGPRLPSGSRVGWAVRPHQLRLAARGGYEATVLRRGPVRDGQRTVTLGFGDAVLTVPADPSCPPEGSCGVDFDPDALQLWPASSITDGTMNGRRTDRGSEA